MHFKVNAIIPAGGTSSRFGNKNKLLEKIYGTEVINGGEASGVDIENKTNIGKEVIKYTVEAFEASNIDEIVICANKTIIDGQ